MNITGKKPKLIGYLFCKKENFEPLEEQSNRNTRNKS